MLLVQAKDWILLDSLYSLSNCIPVLYVLVTFFKDADI